MCHIAAGDRWAGAEVQIAALVRALARRKDVRVSAILLNEGRLAEEARQSGAEVSVVAEAGHNFFQILSQAAHFLRGKEVRILHSHGYKQNLLAALLARRCSIPFHVCSKHGAPEPFAGWQGYKQSLVQVMDRWVARYSANVVISVSAELRRQLTGYLPASKIITIYNGVDCEKVLSHLSVPEAKQRLGIRAECLVVGTAGRLDPVKRLDIFLRAAQQIASSYPSARFVVAGEGGEEARLVELSRKLGLEERVLFLGHRSDIYDVLRAMDLFVICSDHEGLPMALLETLRLEVPVVVRPVGGVAEVIQDGVHGIWVKSSSPLDLAEACVRLLSNETQRKRLSRAGVELVAKQFTSDRTADRLTQLYHSLATPGEMK